MLVSFSNLLGNPMKRKDNVYGNTVRSKAASQFWKGTINNIFNYAIKDESSQDFTSYGKEKHAMIFVTYNL